MVSKGVRVGGGRMKHTPENVEVWRKGRSSTVLESSLRFVVAALLRSAH